MKQSNKSNQSTEDFIKLHSDHEIITKDCPVCMTCKVFYKNKPQTIQGIDWRDVDGAIMEFKKEEKQPEERTCEELRKRDALVIGQFSTCMPKKTGSVEGVYEPPKDYGLLKRIKWHLWDSI